VLDQTTAGPHQALLQAGQRPVLDPFRQHLLFCASAQRYSHP
jgi:hypothetical protein